MPVVRDYGEEGLSVVLASNRQGRVEPFIFEKREDAERWEREVLRSPGEIETVLIYHGVESLDTMAAQRLAFGFRHGRLGVH